MLFLMFYIVFWTKSDAFFYEKYYFDRFNRSVYASPPSAAWATQKRHIPPER